MRLFHSPDYTGAAHAFETTRKAGWVAGSLALEPIEGVVTVSPAPATVEEILEVHDPAYVEAVRTGEPSGLAQSQGFPWDPGLWRMVLSSNGGMVAAALAALEDGVAGTLSSGLHHARRHRGHGWCTFNGLVLAAKAALRAGAAPVLVLDLDAHCGGGTARLIKEEPLVSQIDVSVCRYDPYPATDRCRSAMVSEASRYLPVIETMLSEVSGPVGLCLYNAGMDPHQHSGDGLRGINESVLSEREDLVFSWCRARGIPVAFCLAGGYLSRRLDRDRLVALHRLTIATAVSGRTS
ncbi:MAG: hypothetical protein KGS60_09090 [Verrucomicrobia bacterium]|nr:hypothetical protein [Verrucomicrobiota bacterium]